jgi:hypothetical protein
MSKPPLFLAPGDTCKPPHISLKMAKKLTQVGVSLINGDPVIYAISGGSTIAPSTRSDATIPSNNLTRSLPCPCLPILTNR